MGLTLQVKVNEGLGLLNLFYLENSRLSFTKLLYYSDIISLVSRIY